VGEILQTKMTDHGDLRVIKGNNGIHSYYTIEGSMLEEHDLDVLKQIIKIVNKYNEEAVKKS
jgi:hypothetical protein